ncbi:DUF4174 domain-containing protein [Paracoccus hibiscisoli]|uniref:DUF4174 domain-containing protein n=1 Tax=Paracoccus hibiscisoli TaxID=2023261 RepID=A0A4U0QY72_9RHOB|nr:DUF4174 domain-containing protein [Paracoccus hibiscisoli]TJZ87086.1 DUF4174 domain-containing protein [Paracoccus hibiscisoli]
MKLKFMIFVMALAAMGPARDAPAPDAEDVRDTRSQGSSARLPPVQSQQPAPNQPETDAVRPGAAMQILDASEVRPDAFLWTQRPVVVFADTPDDPSFLRQVESLRSGAAALAGRDVVVVIDSDPAANSLWRQQLRPQGFSLLVIDKDGQVKIRRPSPWDVREIGRAIDRLPLRRQEVGRGSLLR